MAGCARLERESVADASYSDEAIQQEVLVMLRMPAPHFRPDVAYGSNYLRTGQDARRRIADAIAEEYGLNIVDNWPMPALGVDCFVMKVPGKQSPVWVIQKLSADPRVESAQTVNLFIGLAYNDPLYPLQPSATAWHLSDLHRITTGKQVRIAEVDSGVEADHPDLAGQIAVTRDFVGDAGPGSGEQHGTAVAGIIAARPNNGIGIAGIAPDADLLALRACWEAPVSGGRASCSSFTLAKALQFALEQNVEVINLSIGGPRDRLLERLLDVALSRGVTVVGAVEPGASDRFPASHRGVLAIVAAGGQDSAADFLAAPGRDVPTTLPGGKWGFVSGSSFAAAHVTGLVALLRALSPGLQSQQLRQALVPQAISSLATDQPLIVDACAAVARTAGTCACTCTAAGHAQLQDR
jgi:subtilisin family serine protease